MKWNVKKMFLLDLLIIAAGIFLDRITKLWALADLRGQDPIVLIKGVLELHYLENRGAAFGILQNQKIFFLVITTLVSLALIYVLFRMPGDKQYRIYHIGGSVLLAGAIGNFWDRLIYEYVVDFIYVSLINFPIFNVADIYVSVTCCVCVLVVLFSKGEEPDFSFLSFKKKKTEE